MAQACDSKRSGCGFDSSSFPYSGNKTKRNVDFRHPQLSGETQRRAAASSMHKCSYLTLDYVDLQNHDFKLHWTVVLKNE